LTPAVPEEYPDVDVIVPARDEAQTIGAVIGSLLAQDYARQVSSDFGGRQFELTTRCSLAGSSCESADLCGSPAKPEDGRASCGP
jgi:cellulose synthase/poly-beta-1,6-N-acetylglucosamine synthase-like glycosyltransferase